MPLECCTSLLHLDVFPHGEGWRIMVRCWSMWLGSFDFSSLGLLDICHISSEILPQYKLQHAAAYAGVKDSAWWIGVINKQALPGASRPRSIQLGSLPSCSIVHQLAETCKPQRITLKFSAKKHNAVRPGRLVFLLSIPSGVSSAFQM